jgi:hypothetical protein
MDPGHSKIPTITYLVLIAESPNASDQRARAGREVKLK